VGLRFVLIDGGAGPNDDGSLGLLKGTHAPTAGTGLFRAQALGLLTSRRFQGAGQQRPHGRHRHLLHLAEVNVQARSLLAPVAPHDDLSPPLGQFLDADNFLGRKFDLGHLPALLEVADGEAPGFQPPMLIKARFEAK
jgi:hypothetical protein